MLRIDGELFGGASRLHRRPKGRGRDRRVSLSALVGSLAQYLSVPDPESSLVQTLEHGLTSLLGLRASRVRERPEILVELPSVPDSERALVDIPTPEGAPADDARGPRAGGGCISTTGIGRCSRRRRILPPWCSKSSGGG